MAYLAWFVVVVILLGAFGLVGWLRRVVANVDAPSGATGAEDDTTTLGAHRDRPCDTAGHADRPICNNS